MSPTTSKKFRSSPTSRRHCPPSTPRKRTSTTIGEPLKVTLLARYDGPSLEFTAWHRTGHPHDGHDDALEVDCYCGGEIYSIPADGAWARVIQVTPTETVDPGTTIVLNWTSSTM